MAREAFCLASGPSLTSADAESVRRWRAAAPDREVIVVNTTFRLAPWADCLYSMDRRWWQHHAAEVEREFRGELLSCFAPQFPRRVEVLQRSTFCHFNNSGAGAVNVAITRGAKKVYLLGYDCQRDAKARSHWHGDHPKPLSNAMSIHRWSHFFGQLGRYAKTKGVEVVNCSRATALRCFRQAELETVAQAAQEAA